MFYSGCGPSIFSRFLGNIVGSIPQLFSVAMKDSCTLLLLHKICVTLWGHGRSVASGKKDIYSCRCTNLGSIVETWSLACMMKDSETLLLLFKIWET